MRRQPFFYGWWVILSCALMALCSGGIFYSFTAFIQPIANEMGWTYLIVSLAFSLRSVEMGLVAPVTGFLTDRFGPRKLTFLSGLIGGAGLLLLSQTHSLTLFYIAFVVFSLGLSGLGQAVITTAIANWFKKKIGQATGFAVAGYGAGGIFLPLIAWLIANYGWRNTVLILGLGTWLIVLPLSTLLRHKPEQYGYLPNGEIPTDQKATERTKMVNVEFTTAHAVRTKTFWLLASVFAIQFMVFQAVTLHIMPFCASANLSIETSAMLAMFIPLSSIVGRLSGGWLGDISGYTKALAMSFLLQSVGLVFLFYGYSLWQFVVFLVFYGPAFGATLVLRSAIVRECFGVRSFGSIQGLIIGFMTVGGIIGPAFAGWVFDTKGSYQEAWLIFVAAMLVAMVMILVGKQSLRLSKGNNGSRGRN